MKKYVYSFGGGSADGDGKMKDVLGGKGAGLAEMSRAKLPVPPGFTIGTEVCNLYFQNGNKVPAEVDQQPVHDSVIRFAASASIGTPSPNAFRYGSSELPSIARL